MKQSLPRILINEWPGRESNKSPHLKPTGAQEADNVVVFCPGELRVRPGMRPVTFANAISAVTDEVIVMSRFQHALGEFVLYETSAGAIKIGRDPS
jgi:hypothetical protein